MSWGLGNGPITDREWGMGSSLFKYSAPKLWAAPGWITCLLSSIRPGLARFVSAVQWVAVLEMWKRIIDSHWKCWDKKVSGGIKRLLTPGFQFHLIPHHDQSLHSIHLNISIIILTCVNGNLRIDLCKGYQKSWHGGGFQVYHRGLFMTCVHGLVWTSLTTVSCYRKPGHAADA